MKKKIKYNDEPMGELRVVKDFLPPPDRLVLKEDGRGVAGIKKRVACRVSRVVPRSGRKEVGE